MTPLIPEQLGELRIGEEAQALQRPLGRHCLIELYGVSADLLNDLEFTRTAITEASRLAGSTLLREVLHQFNPHGVTALGLLAESHIAIHTWPEYGFAAVDVFLCGDRVTPKAACDYLTSVYKPTFYTFQELQRGTVLRGESWLSQ